MDVGARRLKLSQILNWFADDFGSSQQERLEFIRPYVDAASQKLISSGNARVSYLSYDWSLNDQKR